MDEGKQLAGTEHGEEPLSIQLARGLHLSGTVEYTAAGSLVRVTIEGDSMLSNRLLERLRQATLREPNCWDGFRPEVDLLVGENIDDLVLYFVESRTDWVTERLNGIIEEDPIERTMRLWRGGDAIMAVAQYCEDHGVSVAVALRDLAALAARPTPRG